MTQSAVVLLTTPQQLSHGLELNCESSIITHNSTLGVPIGVPSNGPAQGICARPYKLSTVISGLEMARMLDYSLYASPI